MSLFQHSPENPFHISVGAVLVNEGGKILAHRALASAIEPDYRYKLGGLDEAYILMRESLEDSETLEKGVARGLAEEFGATGTIERYLGSIQITVEGFEKTTLYFLVRLDGLGERPKDDAESFTELVWMEPKELAAKMRAQGAKAGRTDLDESKAIEAYLRYGDA